MKSIFTICFLLSHFLISAQSLEWQKVFDFHTFGGLAPISPTSAKDVENSVYVTVSELDTLLIYKYLDSGEFVGLLDTEIRFDKFTPLINLPNDEFGIVFRVNLQNPHTYLLVFGTDLSINRFSELTMPETNFPPDPLHLISIGNQIYLSFLDGESHELVEILPNDEVVEKFSGSIEIGFGEDVLILDNGDLVFSFKTGNSHLVRCVNPQTGELVWEHQSDLEDWKLRTYRVFARGDELLKLTHDIEWVDVDAIGTLRLIRLNSDNGNELGSTELLADLDCVYTIFDGVLDEVNDRLFLVFFNSCADEYLSLVEFDPLTAEISNSVSYPYEYDELNIDNPAYIQLLDNNQLAFMYKSYVDETQQGNLFVVQLNPDLTAAETLEINLDPPNGSEHITHILPLQDDQFLLTGIIPNNDIFIFTEEVKYFSAMVDLDGIMGSGEVPNAVNKLVMYPNPAKDFVHFQLNDKGVGTLKLYQMNGQLVHTQIRYFDNANSFPVSNLESGLYWVEIILNAKRYSGKLFVY